MQDFSTLKTFLLFVTINIITLAVSCQLKRCLPERKEFLPYQGRINGRIFKTHYYWKIILEPMTGNVVISEVDVFMYSVLSQTKKHVPYAELFDSFRNINFLYPEKKLLSSGLQG
jgi:hypothetical protein